MGIEELGIAAIPAIVVICVLVCQIMKTTALDNKHLPSIAGITGGVLGVVAMKTIPSFPANDVLSAVAIGISSGFAATGVNQLYKQYTAPKV